MTIDLKIINNSGLKKILIVGVFHGDEPQGEFFINEYLKKDYSIKLSTMLAKYDEEALYHIFCHEVAHHFYLNHSSDFYNLLLNIDPLYLENKNNMKKLANEIRDKDYL